MILNSRNLTKEQCVFAEHFGIETEPDGYSFIGVKSDNLFVEVKNHTVTIGYSKMCELYRGMALLKGEAVEGKTIIQSRQMESLAAFVDCSRNAVPKLEMLKSYILEIAALGYDQLYLYTEDTFEIKDYPYFGHWRGRYSAEEIKDLDCFAKKFGIELIPAIQTLAHFNAPFHWRQFQEIRDVGDILLCGNEKTYKFIDSMLESIHNMYSTDKINIGMDEAHLLGMGKYFQDNGYHDMLEIFMNHISRVMQLLNKYGFKPSMWSDMFFKIATGRCTYEEIVATTFDEKTLELIPKNMTLNYWNYSEQTSEYYDNMFEAHQRMGRDIIYTGGLMKWVGFCPNLQFSFNASRTALESAFKYNVRNVMVTGWGDDGSESSFFTMLPGLVLFAEKCYIDDMSDAAIDHRLNCLYGYSLEEFRMLEKPNRLPEKQNVESRLSANPSKTLLWNDPILGQYDRHIQSGTNEYYFYVAKQLEHLKDRDNRFSYIFETIWALTVFLSLKAEYGLKLYSAYSENRREELAALCKQADELVHKLDNFHRIFRKNWLKENKIFGFDVQDIRFGSLRARIVYTKEVLEDYLNDRVKTIPELCEERLYFDCRGENESLPLHSCFNMWKDIVSVNVL